MGLLAVITRTIKPKRRNETVTVTTYKTGKNNKVIPEQLNIFKLKFANIDASRTNISIGLMTADLTRKLSCTHRLGKRSRMRWPDGFVARVRNTPLVLETKKDDDLGCKKPAPYKVSTWCPQNAAKLQSE